MSPIFKLTILSLVLTFMVNEVNAQKQFHRVDMKEVTDMCGDKPQLRGFSRAYCLYIDDKPADIKQVLEEMKMINLKAYRMMKFSRTLERIDQVLTISGGLLALYPVVQYLGNSSGDPDWIFSGIGAGMILLTIPISEWSLSRSNKAMKLHHGSMSDPKMGLKFKGSGLSMSVEF